MAGKKKQAKNQAASAHGTLGNVTDYRHDEATRKNNPPAKIAAEGTIPIMSKIRYEYSPRLLRCDSTLPARPTSCLNYCKRLNASR